MTKTITFNKIIATQHGGILKALAGSVMTASLLISQGAMAADSNSCNALLTLGLYNTTQKTDYTQSQSVALAQFCSADYNLITSADSAANTSSNSQALTIEASYGLVDVGVGSASASASSSAIYRQNIIKKQSEFCKYGFNSSKYLNDSSYYAKQVYDQSLLAWNNCNQINTQGLKFKTNPSINLDSVSVELSATSTGSSLSFKGVSQSGGKAICTTQLPPRNGSSLSGKLITVDQSTYIPFNNSSILTINCNREMIDDPTLGRYADETTLRFVTSAGEVEIPMAAIGKVSRVAYDQAVSEVKSLTDTKFNTLSSSIYGDNGLSSKVKDSSGQIQLLNTSVQRLELSFPVGAIVPFFGSKDDAVKEALNGWWICDGRLVDDPNANSRFKNQKTPNLEGLFLRGASIANQPGGSASFRIPDQIVNSHTTGGFGLPAIYSDPFTHLQGAHTWSTDASIYSQGTWTGMDVPTIPPYTTVVYLIKVR